MKNMQVFVVRAQDAGEKMEVIVQHLGDDGIPSQCCFRHVVPKPFKVNPENLHAFATFLFEGTANSEIMHRAWGLNDKGEMLVFVGVEVNLGFIEEQLAKGKKPLRGARELINKQIFMN